MLTSFAFPETELLNPAEFDHSLLPETLAVGYYYSSLAPLVANGKIEVVGDNPELCADDLKMMKGLLNGLKAEGVETVIYATFLFANPGGCDMFFGLNPGNLDEIWNYLADCLGYREEVEPWEKKLNAARLERMKKNLELFDFAFDAYTDATYVARMNVDALLFALDNMRLGPFDEFCEARDREAETWDSVTSVNWEEE